VTKPTKSSRLPAFYRLSLAERLQQLSQAGWLDAADLRLLQQGQQQLGALAADKMIENVLGTFGLPLALGLNFLVNGREHVVPLAVEEPSIVAALGASAKAVRSSGGFQVHSDTLWLIGQVPVVDLAHPSRAQHAVLTHKQRILDLANSLHPNMISRGGGAKDVEVRLLCDAEAGRDMLVVHLLVDTCDAMGANLVNTMCEGIAGLIEELTDGRVFLRILSNFTDRALVTARATVEVDQLAGRLHTGEQVRDGIVLASDFARLDPYRAVTHNKGIMNGIDALAVASGNDWRAIEAAAHAYAGRGQSYTSLSRWSCDAAGNLVGELTLPLKVGIVGGNMGTNPAVGLVHRLLGIRSARELAEVMAAVGLAQNLGALRALATEGIQRGHMGLHARAVVQAAGVPAAHFDEVLRRLTASGEIKLWMAEKIAQELQVQAPKAPASASAGAQDPAPTAGAQAAASPAPPAPAPQAQTQAKLILLGEHAVVYNRHALAVPLPLTVQARIRSHSDEGVHLLIPAWGVEGHLNLGDGQNILHRALHALLAELALLDKPMLIEVLTDLPRAVGLGSSAAVAVAVIRALSAHFALELSDARINELAFAAENELHGAASGLGNTLATYGKPLLFAANSCRTVLLQGPLFFALGFTGVESLTAKMVAQVAKMHRQYPALYEKIFDDIDSLSLAGAAALEAGDLAHLGELMNINHGLLGALQVSSWEVEELVGVARQHGALGAKLSGGGGGGTVLALCRDSASSQAIAAAMRQRGYQAMHTLLKPQDLAP
jgi:hydroxymethylglutaryl-CoA reductase